MTYPQIREPVNASCLGDSITFGLKGTPSSLLPAGFRSPLIEHFLSRGNGACCPVTMVGTNQGGQQRNNYCYGFPATRSQNFLDGQDPPASRPISVLMDNPDPRLRPRLVSTMIGHNGAVDAPSITQEVDAYRLLHRQLLLGWPDLILVVNTIFPRGAGASSQLQQWANNFNDAIAGSGGVWSALLAEFPGRRIVCNDMRGYLTGANSIGADELHPTAAGYQLAADRMLPAWLVALGYRASIL